MSTVSLLRCVFHVSCHVFTDCCYSFTVSGNLPCFKIQINEFSLEISSTGPHWYSHDFYFNLILYFLSPETECKCHMLPSQPIKTERYFWQQWVHDLQIQHSSSSNLCPEYRMKLFHVTPDFSYISFRDFTQTASQYCLQLQNLCINPHGCTDNNQPSVSGNKLTYVQQV